MYSTVYSTYHEVLVPDKYFWLTWLVLATACIFGSLAATRSHVYIDLSATRWTEAPTVYMRRIPLHTTRLPLAQCLRGCITKNIIPIQTMTLSHTHLVHLTLNMSNKRKPGDI